MGKTAFTDPAAVDAWDLWFRWRDGERLRDLTIDTTWERVARSVAGTTDTDAAVWAQRYADAFSKWQLLPNERLLRVAGTGCATSSTIATQAGLNVAAFVRRSRGAATHFDRDEFIRICALAVRFLDDASVGIDTGVANLKIGLFGMADALSQLGVGYTGDRALAQAREIAMAFCEGCLRGDLALARERGANAVDGKRWGTRLRARGLDGELLAELRRYGMRHSRLTAIVSHPKLALFANNASDSLDPAVHSNAQARQNGWRWQDTELADGTTLAAQTAQLRLRATLQPWIDRPIDTPLLTLRDPDEDIREHCTAFAASLGLKLPRWRLPSQ